DIIRCEYLTPYPIGLYHLRITPHGAANPGLLSWVMLKKHAEVVIGIVALLAGAVISAHTAVAQTNHFSAPLRARQLEGMKVEDADGQKAGIVHNLVLDLNTGNLRYVVIGYGGFFGVRSTLKLTPAQLMS